MIEHEFRHFHLFCGLGGGAKGFNKANVRVGNMVGKFRCIGDPPELIVFENVPRIANRGRHLLDQIGDLLRNYGYAVAETTHDCGEIGGLAQSRKRFLLVARHAEKVPPFLYEPPKRALQSVGSVLSRMALPGDLAAGPMHRIPYKRSKHVNELLEARCAAGRTKGARQ